MSAIDVTQEKKKLVQENVYLPQIVVIDEIIEEHLQHGRVVERLKI